MTGMIELKGINSDNIEDVVALQVTLEQETFLQTTNLKSVADAHMLKTDGIDETLLAIYNDDIVYWLCDVYIRCARS